MIDLAEIAGGEEEEEEEEDEGTIPMIPSFLAMSSWMTWHSSTASAARTLARDSPSM